MTEAITDSAGLNGPVSETAAPRKRTASSGSRATKKVAENLPVENVSIGEAVVNEDGQKVIAGPTRKKSARKSNSFATENGTVASHAADYALKSKAVAETPKEDENKVALWSDRNVRWNLIGTLSKGYNIVTKEAAEKWLTQRGIREATPEEVATYYGK